MPERAVYLIDGFNLYHSIKDAERDGAGPGRWLDLPALCRSTLHMFGRQRVELERVIYFSALARHLEATKPDVTQRHNRYLDALRCREVEVLLAQFKRKRLRCPGCGHRYVRHEEKESDVAIAVRILELFARDECEAVVLVSGDTDVLPAVRAARALHPERTVGVLFPYRRHNRELELAADRSIRLGRAEYEKHQLPDPLLMADGSKIEKPLSW